MIDKMLSSNLDGLQLSKDGYTRFFVFVIRNFNRLLLSGFQNNDNNNGCLFKIFYKNEWDTKSYIPIRIELS